MFVEIRLETTSAFPWLAYLLAVLGTAGILALFLGINLFGPKGRGDGRNEGSVSYSGALWTDYLARQRGKEEIPVGSPPVTPNREYKPTLPGVPTHVLRARGPKA